MEQTERLIAVGTLNPGDMLPSVRQLAQELQVNPMTISKAYALMESQGIINRLRGQGMSVAGRKVTDLTLPEKLIQLEPAVRQLQSLAHQLNLSVKQVADYVTSYLKRIDHE